MSLVQVINASKKFANKTVLDNVSLSLNEGDKVAIIGKNGEGKSTLLKAIYGSLALDFGTINIKNTASITMLTQDINFDLNLSVQEALRLYLDDIFQALKEYKSLNLELSKKENDTSLLKELQRLSDFLESKEAWDIEYKIKRILQEFKLYDRANDALGSLSGGELRRLALCAILLKKPDIMLLDEPTNHLDVYMSAFLEEMLKKSKSCILFISHDRYFIDKIASACLELEQGKLSFFDGNYSLYLSKKLQILAALNKAHENMLKLLKREEEWLSRGVKARLKRNEGRKERLLKMRQELKTNPAKISQLKVELMRANNSYKERPDTNRKKMLFELKNASKSIANKVLFKDFSTRILQGERIAVVGKNGCGKSSFLKILMGELNLDTGELKRGDFKIAYFEQSKRNLDPKLSILELFCPNGGDTVNINGKNMHVYGYLKKFLFPKEFLEQKIGFLSGGEKTRLALALLFSQVYDILVLDEPTNDLDIATINILEDYLISYEGAILLVSHDRYFVDKIATKLYAFENERIEIYHTSYTQYLENELDFAELKEYVKDSSEQNFKQKNNVKLSYKENLILNQNPELIKELESKIKDLNELLYNPQNYENVNLQESYNELQKLQDEVARLEEEYFEVLQKID